MRKPIICERCHKKFIPTGYNQKYCGLIKSKTGCAWEINKAKDKARHQTPEYKAKYKARRQTPEYKLKKYKHNAKGRSYEWLLSDKEFFELIKQPCAYCGETPAGGVDRVDNSKGYTIENSVPCCKWCNIAKKNYPKEEFIKHCKLVAKYN